VVENKPGAFGIVAIQEMMNAQAGRLHADDRQRLHQRDHAGDRAGAAEDQLRRDVAPVTNLIDVPAFLW
jgi:hypothetical protein